MIHQNVALEAPTINWTWFLVGDYDDQQDTFTIKRHYRLHQFKPEQGAHEHPRCDGSYRLIESEGRIAQAVQARFSFPREEKTLIVTNPAHVFSYSE